MEVFQARLDSFNKTKRVRPPAGKSSAALLKWPHPASYPANPTALAEAGFYYNPAWNDLDNVACFLCGKELSEWSPEDDPFALHWEKSRNNCPWAIVRCGLREDIDDSGKYVFKDITRLPTSKHMTEARLASFKNWWPHDKHENHGATSRKIAAAGFVFTPEERGDDTASCFYCDISLNSWDEGDDPWQEHVKRDKKAGRKCAFIAAVRSARAPPPSDRHDEENEQLAVKLRSVTDKQLDMTVEAVQSARAPPPSDRHDEEHEPPAVKLRSVTDKQLDMTVEEWVRQETRLQYEQLESEFRNKLQDVYDQCDKMRRSIEALGSFERP